MSECDRCGDTIQKGHPIDSELEDVNWVCPGCLKDTDQVVQL